MIYDKRVHKSLTGVSYFNRGIVLNFQPLPCPPLGPQPASQRHTSSTIDMHLDLQNTTCGLKMPNRRRNSIDSAGASPSFRNVGKLSRKNSRPSSRGGIVRRSVVQLCAADHDAAVGMISIGGVIGIHCYVGSDSSADIL